MLLTKVRALLAGEVSARSLEAYRQAGLSVFALLEQVEDQRVARKIDGTDPWSAPPAEQAEALCAWNAFLLQAIGDAFLEEDYRWDPGTVGYVPPITADQAVACYGEVEAWLSRAAAARGNPAYEPDVPLPADLPAWRREEPCPVPHIEALLAAMRAARTHAAAAVATFEQQDLPTDRQSALQRLRQLVSEATAKGEYAERLWEGNPPQSLHPRVEQDARAAIERFYLVGQLLAMPRLLDTLAESGWTELPAPSGRSSVVTMPRLPGPGEPGFDPWCLTDPRSRAEWQAKPEARQALDRLWSVDPDPTRTLAIQADIAGALARGDIVYATTSAGRRRGPYYMVPWSAIYKVRRACALDGRQLEPGQQFTYEVCMAHGEEATPFKRQILVADFHATEDVAYCAPGERHDRFRARGRC